MNNSNSSFDRYANLKKNFAPANKSGTAGQIVNDVPEHKTLSDYIRSVKRAEAFDAVASEKKLTVDEALSQLYVKHWGWRETDHPSIGDDYEMHKLIWKAAQENK